MTLAAQADLVGYGLPGGQKHLPEHRDTVRDLNYQLKQLCRHNRDGGYATQRNRERAAFSDRGPAPCPRASGAWVRSR